MGLGLGLVVGLESVLVLFFGKNYIISLLIRTIYSGVKVIVLYGKRQLR